ncbi:CbtB domain-containing protein [Conexibacter sp. SYSU D00693]|uniref:CbtB domain-containing protein n=1 Tax=Conexibacter sp. SYSU D00693 TaxID=2812560 RepID=UPI00196AD6F5|nr:CbtB domain-containing protein [Conexibacter sp. SYSU D00693]
MDHTTTAPTPIPLKDLRPALIVAFAALLGIFLMAFDQGAVSQTGLWLHEVMHDGRHLLGVPCH